MQKQEQTQKHAPGNNYPCDKFKTVSVLLQREGIVPNSINGQYFFPESPDLNNKLIKGMALSILPSTLPNITPISNSFSVFGNGYITLYNFNNEQIVYNLPLATLQNESNAINGNKVLPINAKLNIRQCFVNFAPGQNFAPTLKFSLNLTFFYDYK